MRMFQRWLLALPVSAVPGRPGAHVLPSADINSIVVLIPCNFCSLPGTWVFNTDIPAGSRYPELYTFNNEGTAHRLGCRR